MTTITDPTALDDQYQAASRTARRILTDATSRARVARLVTNLDPWLIDQGIKLAAAMKTGVTTCAHVGDTPHVVHAAAWMPNTLVCPACVRLLTPDPCEDGTCDRCRRHAGRLTAAITAFGPILFGYGLCRSCATETGLTPTKEPHQ
jgi:hypothetical protein